MKELKVVATLLANEGDNGELAKIVADWTANPEDLVMMDEGSEVPVAKVELAQLAIDQVREGEKQRIRRLAINHGLNTFAVYLRDENL
jgi:hypothetical protein